MHVLLKETVHVQFSVVESVLEKGRDYVFIGTWTCHFWRHRWYHNILENSWFAVTGIGKSAINKSKSIYILLMKVKNV